MTDKPRLKIAIGTYGHTPGDQEPQRFRSKGVDPRTSSRSSRSSGRFRRMVRDLEVSTSAKWAPTTYMIRAARLGAPFIALPVFIMRRFHHGGFVVRPDSGIKAPKDLEGKKVGVRAYSVTTGVWTRGIFVNEYRPSTPPKVTWVVDDEEHVTTLRLPPNVVAGARGQSPSPGHDGGSGELQAGLHRAGRDRAGPVRPTGALGTGRSDQRAKSIRSSSRTWPQGRSRLVSPHRNLSDPWPDRGQDRGAGAAIPGSPKSLFDAFVESKKPYIDHLKGR